MPIPQSFFKARSAIRDKSGKTPEPQPSQNNQQRSQFRSTSREVGSESQMDATRGILKLLGNRKDIKEPPKEQQNKMVETFHDMLSQKSNTGFQLHSSGLGSFKKQGPAQAAPSLSTRPTKTDDFAFNRLNSTKFERPLHLFEEANVSVKPNDGPYNSRPSHLATEQPRFRGDSNHDNRNDTTYEIQNPKVSVLGDPYRKFATPSNYRSIGNTRTGIFNNLSILEEQVEQTLNQRSLYLLTIVLITEYFVSFSYLELDFFTLVQALMARLLIFAIVWLNVITQVEKLPFDFLSFVKENFMSAIFTSGKSLIKLLICFWYVNIHYEGAAPQAGECTQWFLALLKFFVPLVIFYQLHVNSETNKFSRALNYRRWLTNIPAVALGRIWAAMFTYLKMALVAVLACWFLSLSTTNTDSHENYTEFRGFDFEGLQTGQLNISELFAWKLHWHALIQAVKLIGVVQTISCLQWRLASVTIGSLFYRLSSKDQPLCFMTFTEINASVSTSGSRVNHISEFHAANNIAQTSKMIFLMTSSNQSSNDEKYLDFGREYMWETFIKLIRYNLEELDQSIQAIKVDKYDARVMSAGPGAVYTFDSLLKHLLGSTGYRRLIGNIARRNLIMTMSLEVLVRTLSSYNSGGKNFKLQSDEELKRVTDLLKSITVDLEEEVQRLKVYPETARLISFSSGVVRELVEFTAKLRLFTELCLNLCSN
jgi:hypothetical protein